MSKVSKLYRVQIRLFFGPILQTRRGIWSKDWKERVKRENLIPMFQIEQEILFRMQSSVSQLSFGRLFWLWLTFEELLVLSNLPRPFQNGSVFIGDKRAKNEKKYVPDCLEFSCTQSQESKNFQVLGHEKCLTENEDHFPQIILWPFPRPNIDMTQSLHGLTGNSQEAFYSVQKNRHGSYCFQIIFWIHIQACPFAG